MKKTTAAFLAGLAFAPALLADKQTPPAPGTPKGFSVPKPTTFTLDNGLGVTLVPYGTVPKVSVNLAVLTGNVDEKANEVWLADLTGDMLSEGTATRSASQIAEDAARMGGSLEIAVGPNRTDIGGDVLSEFGPEMVGARRRRRAAPEVSRDRARAPEGRPRAPALDRRRASPSHSRRRSSAPCSTGTIPTAALFPTEAMLQGYTLAQVRDFYARNFGAARSRIYVVGRFDAAAMEAAIRKAFGDWKRGPAPNTSRPKPTSERAVYLIDRPGAAQSTINVGMPVIDPSNPDWDTLYLTNVLLGGSFSSRITSNIREQKGYTYSPHGQLSNRYRDAYWVEIADVTTNVTGPALKEIFGEVDRLQAEAPTEKELKGFQNYRAGVFVLQNSSRAGIIGQLEFVDLHGLPADYLNGYVGADLRRHAGRGAGDGEEVPPGRQGHDRRRRRPEGHRGAGQGVRPDEVTRRARDLRRRAAVIQAGFFFATRP